MERRILVAEDNDGMRKALCRVFEAMGYQVDSAQNYIEAVALLDAHIYALIVCDNQMPISEKGKVDRTCGLQILGYAKAAGHNMDRPFVLHTADDGDDVKRQVKELGGIYRYKDDASPMIDFFRKHL